MVERHFPRISFVRFLIFIFSIIILSFSTGCGYLENIWSKQISTTSIDAVDVPDDDFTITFNVKTPDNTPEGETILISILDEVTGLGLNADRHKMKRVDKGKYQIKLSLQPRSIIKYRYSRGGSVTAEEHTGDGLPVRYRLFKVQTTGEVNDVVSRWNDTEFVSDTGRITGTLVDEDTGLSIPGLLVTAGGAFAISAGDGSFLIEGLPPGTHNIVVLAQDGSYETYQHAATVEAGSSTPATIQMRLAPEVDVSFILHVPDGTPPGVPIRLAGNLYQLGNTFADLSGGMSTIALRMPILSPLTDGVFGVILTLPVGTEVKYKYTLGDGFWNSERSNNGDWIIRNFIVPDTPMTIEDTVNSWADNKSGSLTFDVTVPENTPTDEGVFIQFNPYGWTEPIPMWHLDGQRWAYILYSPLSIVNRLGYRFCRSGQCGLTDDKLSQGENTTGTSIRITRKEQIIQEQIVNWPYHDENATSNVNIKNILENHSNIDKFFSGIEFQNFYHPSYPQLLPSTLNDIIDTGAHWVILTPGWTFTYENPPVLVQTSGQDPSWLAIKEMTHKVKENHLRPALKPIVHTGTPIEKWWLDAERDFPWWVSWFDRFEEFSIHHAKMATEFDIEYLILGGEWITPALPSGTLVNGDPSGVPPDANSRYKDIIKQVKKEFDGNLCWALSYPENVINPPKFIENVDCFYILLDDKLSKKVNPSRDLMSSKADRIISEDIYSLWLTKGIKKNSKEVFISLAYPSVVGGATGCLADPIYECLSPNKLNYPSPEFPLLEIDYNIQALAYDVILEIINKNEWISGAISSGYFLPSTLHDKSTSLHGKPAEEVLSAWFYVLNGEN